jgi:hypothetical protein
VSCSLYWRPPGKGHQVGDFPLRRAIENRFGRTAVLDYAAVDFLQGLAAAGVDGATELLEAIEKHDKIEIYQEC